MNPVLLQKQLRNNASDLGDFFEDLKTWGDEMKKKEISGHKSAHINTHNFARTPKETPKKTDKKHVSKVGYTDYTAWEKFDAESECEKIDCIENDDSDLTDECDETVREEAYLEKERGNKFVKDKKWNEAIECYNKAIELYSYDAVFYANRALCFFKTNEHIKAELDCTMSIRLDKTYVKAYQRRAAAREALGKLGEAESDLLKVLELEPGNEESKSNLDVLRIKLTQFYKISDNYQRPLSKFTASRNKKIENVALSYSSSSSTVPANQTKLESFNSENSNHLGFNDYIFIKTINKPAHMQSKKILKRVEIQEISTPNQNTIKTYNKTNVFISQIGTTLKTDDLKIIEKQPEATNAVEKIKENKNWTNNTKIKEESFISSAPKNCVQFYLQWSHLKTTDSKYLYIKLIQPENLPSIFGETVDSNIFAEILEVLTHHFIKNNDDVFEFLKFFSHLKRFSTIVVFLTEKDKTYLRQLFTYLRQRKEHSNEEIELLFRKYEM